MCNSLQRHLCTMSLLVGFHQPSTSSCRLLLHQQFNSTNGKQNNKQRWGSVSEKEKIGHTSQDETTKWRTKKNVGKNGGRRRNQFRKEPGGCYALSSLPILIFNFWVDPLFMAKWQKKAKFQIQTRKKCGKNSAKNCVTSGRLEPHPSNFYKPCFKMSEICVNRFTINLIQNLHPSDKSTHMTIYSIALYALYALLTRWQFLWTKSRCADCVGLWETNTQSQW